ncbi:hypothetical protein M0Q97_01645 [Candidatus Dojkabacteria bacterium]|jgi:shikimate dehydrogenase|nr:hypothetical protein [Candidatus Dojkabacteria bacterium]
MINKDTTIFGSFSLNAGNNGNIFFNNHFEKFNINAIYKSFSITNIKDAVNSARCLNFGGFAVSMPFKKEVITLVDEISDDVKNIGACNTVVNKNGKLIAYNTDYIGVNEIIKTKTSNNIKSDIYILGNGGMALATIYALIKNNLKYEIINRSNWDLIEKLKNKIIINCTPVRNIKYDISNIFIDTLPDSEDGKFIHNVQAKSQFYLYTDIII